MGQRTRVKTTKTERYVRPLSKDEIRAARNNQAVNLTIIREAVFEADIGYLESGHRFPYSAKELMQLRNYCVRLRRKRKQMEN
jgi:hypothetical protein